MKTKLKVEKVILNSENYDELVNTIEELENKIEILTESDNRHKLTSDLLKEALVKANIKISVEADLTKPFRLDVMSQNTINGLEIGFLVKNI